jgi:branched-chain amino acid transport system ATP-binding protein
VSRNLLELRDVSISFGTLTVVDALDLDVEEGEIVSLIGPNGAGKTTVFNAITGVYKPDFGSIRLDGVSIVGLPRTGSRRWRREDVRVDPPFSEHVRA